MKLFFTCPVEQGVFATEDYSLQEGHRITEDEHGGKTLMGFVSLNSACPLCGQKHLFEVKNVMCSMSRGKNEG